MKMILQIAVLLISGLLLAGCGNGAAFATLQTPDSNYAAPVLQRYNGQGPPPAPSAAEMTAPQAVTVYFNTKQQIRKADRAALKTQALYLIKNPSAKVRLEGYTAEPGSRAYNVGLAWRSAQQVADFLKQNGVAADQLELVSYGMQSPQMLGTQAVVKQWNHRVRLMYEATS